MNPNYPKQGIRNILYCHPIFSFILLSCLFTIKDRGHACHCHYEIKSPQNQREIYDGIFCFDQIGNEFEIDNKFNNISFKLIHYFLYNNIKKATHQWLGIIPQILWELLHLITLVINNLIYFIHQYYNKMWK